MYHAQSVENPAIHSQEDGLVDWLNNKAALLTRVRQVFVLRCQHC